MSRPRGSSPYGQAPGSDGAPAAPTEATEPKKRGRKRLYDNPEGRQGAPEMRVRMPPELLAAIKVRGGSDWPEWVRQQLWGAVSQPR